MPFIVVRNDITNMEVDAIVNTTGSGLRDQRSVEFAIMNKGGLDLKQARINLGEIKTGEVK